MNQVVPLEQQPRLPTMAAGGPVRAIVPQDFEGAWRIALAVCRAGMAPKGLEAPEQAMVAILHGLEVGLTPMNALQSIAVVNGRPTVWGDGAIGLARGSGLLEWMEERFEGQEGTDAFKALCIVQRKGEPKPVTGEFSVADAKVSGLWSKAGPWKQYPKRMLKMRARAFALRDGFADILKGLGIKEEVEDYHNNRPITREDPPAPPPATARQEVAHIEQPREETSAEALAESGRHDPSTVEWSEPPAEQEAAVTDEPPAPPPPATSQLATASASDFPGDKQMARSDEVEEWLTSLGNALSGCEDTEQLAEAQTKYQMPMKGKVSTADWQRSSALMMQALERISDGD